MNIFVFKENKIVLIIIEDVIHFFL